MGAGWTLHCTVTVTPCKDPDAELNISNICLRQWLPNCKNSIHHSGTEDKANRIREWEAMQLTAGWLCVWILGHMPPKLVLTNVANVGGGVKEKAGDLW